jgi:NAD+ kinase
VSRRTIHNVGIFPNFSKRECRPAFDRLVAWLADERCTVWVSDEITDPMPASVNVANMIDLGGKIDLMVVLGGDGTLLAAARALYPNQVPILGVNFGGLGFLTEATIDELYEALERTLRGDYTLEQRMVLKLSVIGANGTPRETVYGLNDAVLHEMQARLVRINMAIGKVKVGSFKADGLIISTPTGSTGYSLSAGGPVLEPLLDAFVVTPICPHSLAIRPLICSATETIEVDWHLQDGDTTVVVDGQVYLPVEQNESIAVSRADHCSCFVQLRKRSFWSILREKLKWGARADTPDPEE